MISADEKGFALLDMLVAIAILGLIATMLGSTLQRTADLSVDGAERLRAAARVDKVRHLLRNQLQATRNVEHDFLGEPHGMRWTGPRSGHQGDDLYRLQLSHLADPPRQERGALIMRQNLLASPGAEETITLLPEVDAVRIGYFDGEAWQDRWRDPNRLPTLIRIDVRLSATAAGGWPSLVIAPRLARTAAATGASASAAAGRTRP